MATAQRPVGERVAKAAGGLGVVSETGHVVRSHGTHVDEAVHGDDYDCFHGTHTNDNVLFLEPSMWCARMSTLARESVPFGACSVHTPVREHMEVAISRGRNL